jgi:hypothetical protein
MAKVSGTLSSTRVTSKKNKPSEKDVAQSFNRFKKFGEKQYTGMSVGRSHKWNYDPGVWRDYKITPDLWGISYGVTKRRAGRAPEGSGAAVGTGYHWFILAHQHVEKLNADDYSTVMTGLKFKLAHRRAAKGTWNITSKAQRRRLIAFLEEMLDQLRTAPIPLSFKSGGNSYTGEALPVLTACDKSDCPVFEIILNDENKGLIRRLKSGWKMDLADAGLIRAIGRAIDDTIGSSTPKSNNKPAAKTSRKKIRSAIL